MQCSASATTVFCEDANQIDITMNG